MSILEKIESRQAVVGIIGLGYVGLPLAVAFAEEGFRVIGIDIDQKRADAINRGESYISDVPSAQLAALTAGALEVAVKSSHSAGNKHTLSTLDPVDVKSTSQLYATTDYNILTEVDAVIICVPTPLSKTKDPDLSYILAVADQLSSCLHRDMIIILESTTYPGTTVELMLPYLEAGITAIEAEDSGNGNVHSKKISIDELRRQQVGEDFYLAFSPERIDPGRTDFTVRTTPKVIGGVTPRCTEIACALYATIIDQIVPVSSPKVAEMVKLLENTYRAVNIALMNEMAMICDRLEIDVWEVIDAAKTKPYGFTPFYPGPGVGGHCIPIDPQYLAWKMKQLDFDTQFIDLASEINFGMPNYVLDKIAAKLEQDGKSLRDSQVLVLGVSYKANISDMRESPALDLIHLLNEQGAKINYHDPYVPNLVTNGLHLKSVVLDQNTLQSADCVVITTDHSSYDWEWIVQNSRLVMDTRNATKSVETNSTEILKI
jgi:UDP-N-acetyl-D-glucosamine dehydrogenase